MLRGLDRLRSGCRAGQLVDRSLLIVDLAVKRIALLRQIVDGTFIVANDGLCTVRWIVYCIVGICNLVVNCCYFKLILPIQ